MRNKIFALLLLMLFGAAAFFLGRGGKSYEAANEEKRTSNKSSNRPLSLKSGVDRVGEIYDFVRMKKIPSSSDDKRGEFIDSFIRLVQANPQEALRLLQEMDAFSSRQEKIANYMLYAQGLTLSDPLSAIDWATSLEDSTLKTSALGGVFAVWLQKPNLDPSAPLAELEQYKKQSWAEGPIIDAVVLLAEEDADAAISWISENVLDNPELYYKGMSHSLAALANSNPQEFFTEIGRFDLGSNEEAVFSQISHSVALNGVSNVKDFLSFVPEGSSLENSLLNSLVVVFGSEPDAAFELIVERGGSATVEILSDSVGRWIHKDVPAAADWLNGLSQEMRVDIAPYVTTTLASTDAKAALSFIEGLPDSVDIIPRYQSVAESWGQNSPVDALKWIETLDAKTQSNVISNFVIGLNREDSSLAEPYINSANLSDLAFQEAHKKIIELSESE